MLVIYLDREFEPSDSSYRLDTDKGLYRQLWAIVTGKQIGRAHV